MEVYKYRNILHIPTELYNPKKIHRIKKKKKLSKSKTLCTFWISELVDLKYNENFVNIYFYSIQTSGHP